MNAILKANAVASATIRLLFAAGFIGCAYLTQAQPNIPLVSMSAVWKYLDTGVDQGTAWIAPVFNDSGWPSGPGQLGYGDGDEATVVGFGPDPNNKYITTYFRHSFVVNDPSAFTNVQMGILYAGGVVVYLNGAEVFRFNLPSNATFGTLASAHEAETSFYPCTDPRLLVNGTNVLAVEVHLCATNSPSLSFDLGMAANVGIPVPGLPPVVTVQPLSQTNYVGRTMVFEVRATGQSLSYQWLFNGNPIVSERDWGAYALVLTNLQPVDAGNYWVVVSNAGGSVTSAVVTLTVVPPPVHPGAFDPSFQARLGSELDAVFAMVKQSNGQIVVSGTFNTINGVRRSGIARLNADGSLDTAFNPNPNSEVKVLALQADGKLLIGGTFTNVNGVRRDGMARLLSDGTVDASFSPFLPENLRISALAVQTDGKILAAEKLPNGPPDITLVLRLLPDGNFDSVYANSPIRGTSPTVKAIVPQRDGKILLGGDFELVFSDARRGVARLRSNGYLDYSFNPGTGAFGVSEVVLQPDGRIVIGGAFDTVNDVSRHGVARLMTNGSVDTSFVADVSCCLNAVALQPDGKILIGGGFRTVNGVTRNGVARLLADGSVDLTFDPASGISPIDDSSVMAIVVQEDGNIVIGGTGFVAYDGFPCGGLARLYGGSAAVVPTITLQPASQTNVVGSTVTFTVTATGTPPLRYQWQKDGANLSGQTNASLTLVNVLPSAAGRYRVMVSNTAGSVTSAEAALIVLPGQLGPAVVINEVLAHNHSVTNGNGTITDWVELCNLTAQSLDLADCSLTDDPANPRRWVFPAGTIVPANGFLVVRCDGGSPPSTNSVPILNTGFSLYAGGGRIYLFNRLVNGGAMLDSLVFGLQAADYSLGRVPDGGGAWDLCRPTAGAPNVAASLGDPAALKINEWMANMSTGGDWFELYNPEAQPVAIGDCYLTDDLAVPTKFRIPARSYVGHGAHAYAVFYSGMEPVAEGMPIPFRLSNSGESIGLFTASGERIDAVSFGPQDADISEGRLPDGAANIVRFPSSATPGAPNRVLVVEPPSITQQPLSQTNLVGSTVTFSVTASGTSPLTYQWWKDGVAKVEATNASLTLRNVQTNDAGLYYVVVGNAHGSVISSNASLNVVPASGTPEVQLVVRGAWPDGTPTNANSVAVQNGYAYVGTDNGLCILEVSNPRTPRQVGWVETPDILFNLAVSGNYAYLAAETAGLQVIDISNPAAPRRVGTFNTGSYAMGVAVSGNYAYVVDEDTGLFVIDVNDPASPQSVAQFDVFKEARGVAVSGNYLYVSDVDSDRNAFVVYDISNPLNCHPIAASSLSGCYSLAASGQYVYAARGYAGLGVVDIGNPAQPGFVGSCLTTAAVAVAVSGRYACVADYSAGLQVIDIALPTHPMRVGGYPTGEALGVATTGRYVYVANRMTGLRILEIATPVILQPIGRLDTSGFAQGLTLAGNYAYVADGDGGLQVVNMSDPANPQRVGGYDTTGYALAVVVSGDYAYVADGFSGVQVIDVSNPANPHRVGGYQTNDMYAECLAVSGNYVFVVGDEALHLRVLDISDPTNPDQVGGCQIGGEADGITLSGHYAYLADGDFGLRVVDISDPSNPQLVGSCQTDDDAEGVVVSGHYAYVADEVGLKVIDIIDPAHPIPVGACGISGYGLDVAVSGHYAYVASPDAGVQVIDISDPANPRRVASNTSFSAFGIFASGDNLYVAAAYDGLVIFRGMPENHEPPTITSQPVSQTNFVSRTVVFDVQAAGAQSLSYQWFFNGNPIASERDWGASALVLTNIQSVDAGRYWVVVSNFGGSVTSAVATLTVLAPPVHPGAFDPSFQASFDSEFDEVFAVVKQTNGQIIVSGLFSGINGVPRDGIARLNADGSLDSEFNPIPNSDVEALAVQDDGKLVMGGAFTNVNGVTRNGIARLNADGTLDASFSAFLPAHVRVSALALQPDGKIMAAVKYLTWEYDSTYVLRLLPDGNFDPHYAVWPIRGNWPSVHAIVLQPDGKTLLGGDFETLSFTLRRGVARLNSDGNLDYSFNPGTGASGVIDLVLQSDGRIVIGGAFDTVNEVPRHGLARLMPDGSVDTSFVVDVGCCLSALALQADGKLLIGGGFRTVNGVTRNGVARLNPDGSVDLAFDSGTGISPIDDSSVLAMVVQDDGRIVIAGTQFVAYDGFPCVGLARLYGDSALYAPTILQQPVSRTVVAGGTVTFSVTATGTPPLAYQWQKDGVNLSGQTNATLALSNVQPPDIGAYRVQVWNSFGSVTSTEATLSLWLEPSAGRNQNEAAVASDGQNYLVVWTDNRNRDSSDWDIYGARLDANGVVLDPCGIPICTCTNRQYAPAAAFDGTNYLVVWTDRREFVEGHDVPKIYGARVTCEGQVLDPGGFRISTARMDQDYSQLAFNGTNYLVVWMDWRYYETTICDIYGTRVSPSGEVLDPEGISINVAPYWQTRPRIATLGGHFYVVWDDGGMIRGTVVRADGTVVSTSGTVLGLSGNQGAPAVSASHEQYLVTWDDTRFMQVGDGGYYTNCGIYATRVSQQGVVLDATPIRLQDRNEPLYHSRVVGTGTDFWVVWQEGAAYGGPANIWGARLTGSGVPGTPFTVSAAPRDQAVPCIAWSGVSLLAVWEDGRLGQGEMCRDCYDIYGARLNTAGQVLDPDGLLVSLECFQRPAIVVQPVSQTNLVGSTVTFSVTASGTPPLSYQWQKDGANLSGQTSASLMLANVQLTDAGRYRVIVSNAAGYVTSTAARSTVVPNRAGPGSLDPTFWVNLDSAGNVTVLAIAKQPDGKLLIGGEFASVNGVARTNVARLLPSGAVDTSFNVVLHNFHTPTVRALAVEADGKILIGGYFTNVNGVARCNVARLNPDGSLDAGINAPPDTFDNVTAVAFQSDGKILVAGHNYEAGRSIGVVIRFNRDGSLDPSYSLIARGGYGIVAMAVQPDDKAVIAGEFGSVNGVGPASVSRIDPDGSVDLSFAPEQGGELYGLALQPDGKTLISGYVSSSLVRLNSDGTIDSSFSSAGGAPPDECFPVLQGNGRILVGGRFGGAAFPDVPFPGLRRLNHDGSVDTSFDPGTGVEGGTVRSMLVQDDGQILVGGYFDQFDGVPCRGLVRLNGGVPLVPAIARQPLSQTNCVGRTAVFDVQATGTQPLSYQWARGGGPIPGATNVTLVLSNVQRADAGRYTVLVSNPYGWIVSDEADLVVPPVPNSPGSVDMGFTGRLSGQGGVLAVVQQADGKLLVGGESANVNGLAFTGLARLLTDGGVDTVFNVSLAGDLASSVSAIAMQADGRIVIAGSFTNVNGVARERVARLLADGNLDSSLSLPAGLFDQVEAVAVQSEDKVLVGGYRYEAGSPVGVLARLNADGSLDSGFSVRTEGGQGIAAIVVQADDKILVGGEFDMINGLARTGVARLEANGSVDLSFNPGTGAIEVLHLALQSDGRILLGGFFDYVDGWLQPKLARLGADGAVDHSFSPQVHGTPTSIAVQRDGQIVVSGIDLVNGVRFPGLARLNNDGSPDRSFEAGAGPHGGIAAVCLQSDGKIVAGGIFSDFDFVPCNGIVRLNGNPAGYACRLAIEPSPRTGQPQVLLAGPIGARVLIEATSDLKTWTPLMTVTNTLGGVLICDPSANGSPQRFYRAQLID